MHKKILIIVSFAVVFLAAGCKQDQPPKHHDAPIAHPPHPHHPPEGLLLDSCCANVSELTGRQIGTKIAELWTSAFTQYHFNNCAGNYSVGIDAALLSTLLDGPGVDGVRLYFGIDSNEVSSGHPFVMMLTPFKIENGMFEDTHVSNGLNEAYVLRDEGGVLELEDLSVLEPYFDDWKAYQLADTNLQPVYAQAYSADMLQDAISKAQLPLNDGDVHFHFGLRSISMVDNDFGSKHERKTVLTNPAPLVHFAIASEKTDVSQSTDYMDFARPCPRFCGITLFDTGCDCQPTGKH